MGQYYHIVNLDKKEFLVPHVFGDGLKLMEFGSGGKTLTGLAILLSAGNGRGGGDFGNCTVPDGGGTPNHTVIGTGGVFDHETELTHHPLVGSWAGDRIIIAGDYFGDEGDEGDAVYPECGKWTKPRLQRAWGDDWRDNGYASKNLGRPMPPYSACGSNEKFKDISGPLCALLANGDDYTRGSMYEDGIVDKLGNVTYYIPSYDKYGWEYVTDPDTGETKQVCKAWERRKHAVEHGYAFPKWRRNLDPEHFMVTEDGDIVKVAKNKEKSKVA
jgi:hypothetical protein